MKHWKDIDRVVHCEGAIAAGEFTLCGLALDGERGDTVMIETAEGIDCNNCIAIVDHCRTVRGIKPAFQRRRR